MRVINDSPGYLLNYVLRLSVRSVVSIMRVLSGSQVWEMDRFTKNYTIALGAILLAVLAWGLYEDPLVSELNNLLEQDSEVAAYPYPFRVIEVENGLATMTTPRTSEFPVQRALGLLFPHLANRAQDNPDLMAAQQRLAHVQKRAMAIVLRSGKVKRVHWKLDKEWLGQQGVTLGIGG